MYKKGSDFGVDQSGLVLRLHMCAYFGSCLLKRCGRSCKTPHHLDRFSKLGYSTAGTGPEIETLERLSSRAFRKPVIWSWHPLRRGISRYVVLSVQGMWYLLRRKIYPRDSGTRTPVTLHSAGYCCCCRALSCSHKLPVPHVVVDLTTWIGRLGA